MKSLRIPGALAALGVLALLPGAASGIGQTRTGAQPGDDGPCGEVTCIGGSALCAICPDGRRVWTTVPIIDDEVTPGASGEPVSSGP